MAEGQNQLFIALARRSVNSWLGYPMAGRLDTSTVLSRLNLFCRRTFKSGPAGKVLAEKLGLTDESLLERFQVGYASESLARAIPRKGSLRDTLADLDLITEDGRLAIAGCLIIPVLGPNDTAAGLVIVGQDGRERRIPHSVALHGMNPIPIREQPTVFVGSVLKALRFIQAGVMHVVALGENPTEADENFLRENRPQKAYCGSDSPAILGLLQKLEIPCFRFHVTWPATLGGITEALRKAEPVEARIGEDATVVVSEDCIRFKRDSREYELRDLAPGEPDRLRVRLKALRNGHFHLDTLDLYAARSRAGFGKAVAALYDIPEASAEEDLCLMIRKLESMRASQQKKAPAKSYVMTPDEEADALAFLKQPDLLDRVIQDMTGLGYIGESLNKKIGYLVTISRKLDNPLSAAILSRAGAGKSTLMEVLAGMLPPEDLVFFTRITPQALYYAGQEGLRNKVLMSGEDEGIAGSDYALRELISSKRIRLAAPLRESDTGKFKTTEYEVEGPIALLFSTTKPSIHFENATRCFMLCLDEGREQTQEIHRAQKQRHTLAKLEGKATVAELQRLHRNAQRLLKRVAVVNPFAPYLEFPTQPLEMRREHEKYLSLIDAIALLHQHQRRVKKAVVNGREVEYIEVAVEDVAEANQLMTEILGTCSQELSKPSRELLASVRRMVDERSKAQGTEPSQARFNRRDIREYTGWSDNQIKAHIRQLEDLQYLLISRSERGRTYRYELSYDVANPEKKRLSGLTDVSKLKALAGKAAGTAMVGKLGMVGRGWAEVACSESAANSNRTGPNGWKVGRNGERSKGTR